MSATVSYPAAVPFGSAAVGATKHSSSSAAAQGDDVNLLGKVAGAAAAAGANTEAAQAAALERMDAAVVAAAASRNRVEKRGAPETNDVPRKKIPTLETATDDQIRTAATSFVSHVSIIPWEMLNTCELVIVNRVMGELGIGHGDENRSKVSKIVAAVFADARAAKRAAESEFE